MVKHIEGIIAKSCDLEEREIVRNFRERFMNERYGNVKPVKE